ncbi:MAG: T9SS type A sorting domain-containing protein, partial [bacterium]
PGNAIYGYSDRFDHQFFKYLFIDNIYHIGNALSAAKSVYVPYAAQENVYRWCEYQVNLLGDPEMPIWTDIPRTMMVQYPDELPLGDTFCSITVTDNNQPIEGALVCLMQDADVYETGITGIDGTVSFEFLVSNPANNLQLTVTAQNFIPYEGTISLFTDEPYVQIASFSTYFSNPVFVPPDTGFYMHCWFKNYGNKPAMKLTASLSSLNNNVALLDSVVSIGSLLPGDSVYIYEAFPFMTNANLGNGEVIPLKSVVTDSAGNRWTGLINLIGARPILSYAYYQIADTIKGDGDGFAEPGESITLNLAIQNTGLGPSHHTIMTIANYSPFISVAPTLFQIWKLPASDTSIVSLIMNIDASCPALSFQPIMITFDVSGKFHFVDSFFISIGEFGIRDNMEKGFMNWTHSGSPDLWHLTSDRKHSGNFSWHCGNKETIVYDNNMENSLVSQPFIIDANSELSFWCWYQCPNYGVNGFNPEINDGSGWKKLDFIGSGGALGILPTGNDWLRYTYDLSHYPAGTSLQLRFRFVSDNEIVTEGVYIDDVAIQNKQRGITIYAPPRLPTPKLICSEENNKIKLSWDSNFEAIENYDKDGYTFQGYNVYQLYSPIAVKSNSVRVATFDIIDGVTEIAEDIIDPDTGLPTQITQQYGTDSGIQRNFTIDEDYLENYHLVKGKPYYFAVTAYSYNPSAHAMPKCTESVVEVVEIVFQKDIPGFAYGDTVQVTQIAGTGNGSVIPIIKDPSLLTAHNYYIDFIAVSSDSLVWNLTDVTTNAVLLSQQTNFSGDENYPIIDGFKIKVREVIHVDFSELIIEGSGTYYIGSYYTYNWAETARAIDVFGRGTTDKKQLEKDYELRFTGQYENPNADIVYIKNGTGSIATIYAARYYELKDHPMNPNPGSNDPFTVRIPFEVWNVDDDRQVNFIIYDRIQHPNNRPFYAFNPNNSMYCYILNTPYHETVADFNGGELDNLTWNLAFRYTQFNNGDVIKIIYDNAITPEDIFAFTTSPDTDGVFFPDEFELYQNYPNPFNLCTTFCFDLPKSSVVTLKIYNLLGKEVETLIKDQLMIGRCEFQWTAKGLASGLYFYRLKAGEFSKTRKFILVK